MIWIVYHGSYPQISLVVVCKVLNPQYCHFYHTFCPGTEFYQSDKWLLSSEETAFVGRLYKYVLLFFLYFIYFFVLHLCACLFMCFQINRNFSELCQSGKKTQPPAHVLASSPCLKRLSAGSLSVSLLMMELRDGAARRHNLSLNYIREISLPLVCFPAPEPAAGHHCSSETWTSVRSQGRNARHDKHVQERKNKKEPELNSTQSSNNQVIGFSPCYLNLTSVFYKRNIVGEDDFLIIH